MVQLSDCEEAAALAPATGFGEELAATTRHFDFCEEPAATSATTFREAATTFREAAAQKLLLLASRFGEESRGRLRSTGFGMGLGAASIGGGAAAAGGGGAAGGW